jgi:hypothetical protein
VDGEFTVSLKHPTNPDGSCNWRTVYGPPLDQLKPKSGPSALHWFLQFSEAVAESIRHLLMAPGEVGAKCGPGERAPDRRSAFSGTVNSEGAKHRTTAKDLCTSLGADVESYSKWLDNPDHFRKSRPTSWLDRPLRIILFSIFAYAVLALGYVGWHHV